MHHLKADTIAVEPLRGWRGARVNQSIKALQWLYWQQHQQPEDDTIRHVRNGGEVQVMTRTEAYFVDGYDKSDRTIYEFHGCLWHGCPTCHPDRDVKHYTNPDRSMAELHRATEQKTRALRQAGYTVVECWEHEWDERVCTDPDVKAFLSTFELVPPLDPRAAFFGGRTGE